MTLSFHEPIHFSQAGITCHNRIALAPMTNTQSHDDGTLGDHELQWLGRRADGGFGMIITCASHVHPSGQGWRGQLACYDDRHLPGLTRLARRIHAGGALGLVQIFHAGGRAIPDLIGQQPVSASDRITADGQSVRALAADEIESMIQFFVDAARRAYQAGFDGVELHGAHGYLLAQFLNPLVNHRQDQWGGSIDNRARILRDIIRRIRNTLPRQFLVGVRLSPESVRQEPGIDTYECLEVARQLVVEGTDYLHYSLWDAFKRSEQRPDYEGSLLDLLVEQSPAGVPIMVAGQIATPSQAETILQRGASMVALGRIAIGNPDWPRLAVDRDYRPIPPPYSPEYLRAQDLGPEFIEYMKRWPNFVEAAS